MEIIETTDEIDVWYVDQRASAPPVKNKPPRRKQGVAPQPPRASNSNHEYRPPHHHHHHHPEQYSASLEGLNRMGKTQSKPKVVSIGMKKMSESVPNLEQIPPAVRMPPRHSLDKRVLDEIDEDSSSLLYRSCDHSSSIELNSILHRDSGFLINKCSDAKSAPFPGGLLPQEMNNSSSNEFQWYTKSNKLDGFEMKVNNQILGKKRNNLERDSGWTPGGGGGGGSPFNRFSKSIQNLFNFSDSGSKLGVPVASAKAGRKSVSEVNLAKVNGGRKRGKVGDSSATHVLGSPYCPSTWFTMKTNLKRNATMDSPKGAFGRAWKKYKSMSLFKRTPHRNGHAKR